MSDPNEQPEATQQGAESAQEDTESRVNATEAAERQAENLGVDLASVEGTGPGGRIEAEDVENAQRQSAATASSAQQILHQPQPCNPDRDPSNPTVPLPDGILMQYVVLKATLAGSRDGDVLLQISDDKGTTVPITGANFPSNPRGFFAPKPPSAPVKWEFLPPQPLLPRYLTGTCQACSEGQCDLHIDIGVSNIGSQSVSQQSMVPSGTERSA